MLPNQFAYVIEFCSIKSSCLFKSHRVKPEFCHHTFALHMNMRRFAAIKRNKEETVGAYPQDVGIEPDSIAPPWLLQITFERFAHHKLVQEIGSFFYLCVRHGKWKAYLRGKRDALRMLPAMWQKRRTIQGQRRVPNFYLRSLMTSMFTFEFAWQKIRQMIRG